MKLPLVKNLMDKPLLLITGLLILGIGFDLYEIIATADYTIESMLGVIISGLLLLGLLKGHRLVWQWGRIISGICVFLAPIVLIIGISSKELIYTDLPLIILSFGYYLIIFLAFGTDSIRQHFKLICPNCKSKNIKAVGLFFNKAKCKQCELTY